LTPAHVLEETMTLFNRSLIAVAALLAAGASQAGPVIIDGTDSADHGSFSSGANQAGWEYMQRALTNLGTTVSSTVAKVVTVIGTDSGTQARNAITSAFNFAGLTGWSINYVSGAAAINTALSSLSTTTTGILYLSTAGLVSGDMDATELAAVNSKAAEIASFVGGAGDPTLGGALFAQGESGTGEFGWLETLIPGIVSTDIGGGGTSTNITLTAAGTSAFPGLTNSDLAGADPWHSYFSGSLGSLSTLGVADFGGASRSVIIGGGVGTVITGTVAEPGSLALVALAGLGLLAAGRRRRAP
jgi:MYXO-CTERM domain-containing protein